MIASGLAPNAILAAAAGEPVGTRFEAREGRYSSFKLWLKYAKPARGRVLVDAGAARALREGGTSLLPVGVVDVAGDFDAGDAVEIAHDGDAVGKGICNYSADELRQVRGLKSAAVRELLATRERGGGPPRLLRARVGEAASLSCAHGHDGHSVADTCAAAKRASRTLATLAADVKDARSRRSRRRSRPRRRDPRGQRP